MVRGGAFRRELTVPYNGKIADITHADTAQHLLDLAAALGDARTIVSVSLAASRQSGTGMFNAYPNEGARIMAVGDGDAYGFNVIIAAGTQRLQYSLSVKNDDYDLYCHGYVVLMG